jgi:transposase-like protein
MSDRTLTERQQYYLDILNGAERGGQSVASAAREHGLPASALYSARRELALKGVRTRPSSQERVGFAAVPVTPSSHTQIELRTRLGNGQAVWFGVPGELLGTVLKELGS